MPPLGERETSAAAFGPNMLQDSLIYADLNDNQHSQWSGAVGINSRGKGRKDNQMARGGAQGRRILLSQRALTRTRTRRAGRGRMRLRLTKESTR